MLNIQLLTNERGPSIYVEEGTAAGGDKKELTLSMSNNVRLFQ